MPDLGPVTTEQVLEVIPRFLGKARYSRGFYLRLSLDAVERAARYGDLPWTASPAAFAIWGAVASGRLNGAICARMEALGRRQVAQLIVDVVDHIRAADDFCGSVPALLIRRYDPPNA